MSESRDKLLGAMRKRHQAAVKSYRLSARVRELRELGPGPELLEIAEELVALLQDEMKLNERLTAYAMGMQEAGAISNDELNCLMGLM